METYLQKVKDRNTDMGALHTRMDGDKDLLYLLKYVMKDLDNKTIPGIVNVTLNDPAVFAANVISSLGGTKQQTVVETEDKSLDATYIEEFQEAALSSANAGLRKQGKAELNPFTDEQLCIRGRAATRCMFKMENGELIPDILNLDTRYLTFDHDKKGVSWFGYETSRKKADIQSEYPKVTVSGKEGMVLDVWDREHNEVWIDNKKQFEQINTYGYPPIVLQVVSLGSMLQDKDALSHTGESIFFLIRDIIPELNRLVSILQTINLATVKGAKQWATKEGPRAKTPVGSDDLGAMTAIEIGGGITLVPIADIKRAATLLHSMLESRMQRGSLTAIDLGNLAFPLSAVALVEIGEGRDQVFLPRLQSKALLNQGLADMFTDQVIKIGGAVELGTKGHKRRFDTGKLTGEYETTYRYYSKSPKIDIARYSVASAAERYLDRDTILRDVLQVEDPDAIKERRYFDMAEVLFPMVMKRRVIESLIKQGKDEEAKLAMAEAGITLEQLMSGEVPKVAPGSEAKPEEKPEPLVPLLEQPGAKTSAQKAAELKATPRENESE